MNLRIASYLALKTGITTSINLELDDIFNDDVIEIFELVMREFEIDSYDNLVKVDIVETSYKYGSYLRNKESYLKKNILENIEYLYRLGVSFAIDYLFTGHYSNISYTFGLWANTYKVGMGDIKTLR